MEKIKKLSQRFSFAKTEAPQEKNVAFSIINKIQFKLYPLLSTMHTQFFSFANCSRKIRVL